jgi:hypothetical protein
VDLKKSTILLIFATLSLGGCGGHATSKKKTDELGINLPISLTHRMQNTSKNQY